MANPNTPTPPETTEQTTENSTETPSTPNIDAVTETTGNNIGDTLSETPTQPTRAPERAPSTPSESQTKPITVYDLQDPTPSEQQPVTAPTPVSPPVTPPESSTPSKPWGTSTKSESEPKKGFFAKVGSWLGKFFKWIGKGLGFIPGKVTDGMFHFSQKLSAPIKSTSTLGKVFECCWKGFLWPFRKIFDTANLWVAWVSSLLKWDSSKIKNAWNQWKKRKITGNPVAEIPEKGAQKQEK